MAGVHDIKVERNKTHVTCCGARTLRAAWTIVSTLGWRPHECGRGKHECLRHLHRCALSSRTLRVPCDFSHLNTGPTFCRAPKTRLPLDQSSRRMLLSQSPRFG